MNSTTTTAATTRSPLQAAFGHEENLSAHLGTKALTDLLAHVGVEASGPVCTESRVAHGHKDKTGRLDVLIPTTAGLVIVETQYGTSDGCHLRRLPGYARSVVSPLCIVWVAEQFRAKDIIAAEAMETPVLCLQVIHLGGKRVELRPAAINPKPLGSLAERSAAHQRLLERLSKKFDRDKFANYCIRRTGAKFSVPRDQVEELLADFLVKGNYRSMSCRIYDRRRNCSAWRGTKAELFVCHRYLTELPLTDEVMDALSRREARLIASHKERNERNAANAESIRAARWAAMTPEEQEKVKHDQEWLKGFIETQKVKIEAFEHMFSAWCAHTAKDTWNGRS